MLGIPKQLQSLRWYGNWSCFSIGSCVTPFYHHLGEALSKHKPSLETLDLDLRGLDCTRRGHAGNPAAKFDDMIPAAKGKWKDDWHLIGSLKDFTSLKALTIEPQALCGDKLRGLSAQHMVDTLPHSIEELRFTIPLEQPGESRQKQLEENIWMEQVVDLAHGARNKLPRLRKVEILTLSWVCWEKEEDEELWSEVEMACRLAGIVFEVKERKGYMLTPEKFFQEVISTNKPRPGLSTNH